MRYRTLKAQVEQLLREDDLTSALAILCQMPGRQVVNPLFSFRLCSNMAFMVFGSIGVSFSNLRAVPDQMR